MIKSMICNTHSNFTRIPSVIIFLQEIEEECNVIAELLLRLLSLIINNIYRSLCYLTVIFLLTGLRIYTGESKAQGPTT